MRRGAENMGDVLVIMRILPSSPDVDLDELMKEIQRILPENVVVRQYKKEDFAYGLSSLVVGFTMPDEEGYAVLVEQRIKGLDDVEELTIERITRIL